MNIKVRKRTGSMDIQKELRKTERHPYFNVTLVSDDTINISGRKSIRRNKFERKAYALKRPLLKTLFFIGIMLIIIGFLSIIIWSFKMPVNAKEYKITYAGLVMQNGMSKPPFELYSKLKDECYSQEAKNKAHCIKTGLSIAYAESSWKDLHTPFGLQSKDKGYKKWVKSYNKYWHTATDGFFFYGDWGKLGKSHYCTSEHSSGSKKGCPNGKKNFNRVFYNIKFD